MTLAIAINGKPYTNFKSASVNATVAAITRGFSFTSSADENASFAIKIGDDVTILADNVFLLSGYIEKVTIDYDDMSHDITVSGRSYLLDLVDSSLPIQFEINGTSLESVCNSVIKALSINASVTNEAGTIKNFGKEISSGEIGQNAFAFLEKYSRKRQILLTSDGSNNLVFARAGTEYAPSNLKNVRYANDNNVLSANREDDASKRFYQYVVKTQLNTTTSLFDEEPKTLADQEGKAFDNDEKANIRQNRLLVLNSEESSDSFSAKDRATWEKNMRIGASITYKAKVVGNSVNGKLWLPNTLVKVVDDFCQLDRTMLIRDVQYNFDLYSGSTTSLTMIPKEALTLEVEKSQRAANTEKKKSKKKDKFAGFNLDFDFLL